MRRTDLGPLFEASTDFECPHGWVDLGHVVDGPSIVMVPTCELCGYRIGWTRYIRGLRVCEGCALKVAARR